jgi:hypothetical protein
MDSHSHTPTQSTPATPAETIHTYRAELEATGRVEREGVSLSYDAAAVTVHIRAPESAPWVLDYGKGGRLHSGVIHWRPQHKANALVRFAGEVRNRMNARLAPIREAEALAARLAAPVDLARIIDLLESAASYVENTPEEGRVSGVDSLAGELSAAAEKLRAKGVEQ